MFEKLFEPIVISRMEVKNRLVMTPFSTGYAASNGEVTQRMLDYYAARARGGVGLLIVEFANVQPEGKGYIGTMLGCYHDKLIPGLHLLARTIKEGGARAALQICHAGRQSAPQFTETGAIYAPSSLPLPGEAATGHSYAVPKEMTVEEIEQTIEAFGDAAVRVKQAGFDAVVIHGAHGYLLFGFFSPLQNKRTDKYGGSLENRMRLMLEVTQRVRQRVGPDYPVGLKLSVDEYLDGGVTIDQSAVLARELEKAGISWLECSAGTYESCHHMIPPAYWPLNHNVHLAEAMKKAVSIPVITIGRHGDPTLMEEILAQGKADMVSMGRQLFCDAELPNKIRQGRLEDIRRCIACNECLNHWFNEWPIACAISPEVGREVEYAIRPATKPRRVLVIGGGPAGLEAAWVAALRGHDVTVFEKNNQLGGQLNVASVPDLKEPLKGLMKYQEVQAKKAGVKIRLGKEATVDNVKAFAPDVVIVATGAKPIMPSVAGIKDERIVLAANILRDAKAVGQNVLVVGGGYIGCEIAVYLARQGKRVTIAEARRAVGLDIEGIHALALSEMIARYNIAIRVNVTLREIRDGRAVFVDKSQKEVAIAADTIVLAVGYKADTSLAEALTGRVAELYVIGDCVQAGNIFKAFHDGAYIGRHI